MKNLIDKAQNDSTVMLLTVIAGFLLGIVIGILVAPVKKGMSIASNNTIVGCDDDDDDDYDYYDYDE
ncbi:MAG: hypothetical protein NC320_00375 [Clostridium sp.]|nr:hypothetical protein [Clostridium sp.]MCM1546787.1 hypothetical protein [Ruminococcus sp.]